MACASAPPSSARSPTTASRRPDGRAVRPARRPDRLLLQDELLRLWDGSGRTVVFVTHDLVEAIALSDRIAIFTSAPGRIKEIREVRIPRPRDVFHIHESPGFGDIYDAIWNDLRDEIPRARRLAVSERDHERALLAGEADRARRAARTDRLRVLGWQVLLLALLLGGWTWASGRIVDRLFLSDPVSIARAFWAILLKGTLWYHLRFTLTETLLGYVIGAGLGLAGALVVSMIPAGEPVLRPFVLLAYATPKIALAPLMIIWFGSGCCRRSSWPPPSSSSSFS